MCTSLVVYDEYWKQQFNIYTQLSGIKIDYDYIVVMGKCLAHIIDTVVEVFNELAIVIKDSMIATMEALSDLFKQCEVAGTDCFDTICDKLENRILYLNRQNYIKQEQYYKVQFKLIKDNYNVMNHDRRY